MFENLDDILAEKKDYGPRIDLQAAGYQKQLLIISITEYREVAFKDKRTGQDRDALIADITVVDTGEEFESQMISAGTLVGKLKKSVGKLVLARLNFGPIPGNTEGHKGYSLQKPSEADVAAATKLVLSKQASDPFAV